MKLRLQLYTAVLLCWFASLLICVTYFLHWHVNLYLVGILLLNAGMLMTHPTYYSALMTLPGFERWRRWQWLALFLALLPALLWCVKTSLQLLANLLS